MSSAPPGRLIRPFELAEDAHHPDPPTRAAFKREGTHPMKLHRKGLLAATGAAAAGLALTGGLIAASAASAATAGHRAMTAQGSAAVFNTLSSGHMDTTSYSGPATFTSPNGPVWAIDTLREHWVVTSCAASPTCTSDNDGANYAVTLTVQKGSKFAEFADPGQGTTENGVAGGPGSVPRSRCERWRPAHRPGQRPRHHRVRRLLAHGPGPVRRPGRPAAEHQPGHGDRPDLRRQPEQCRRRPLQLHLHQRLRRGLRPVRLT